MQLQPILIPDQDGLRIVETTQGKYPMVRQHNPTLIAEVVAEKVKRNLIRSTNEKLYGVH